MAQWADFMVRLLCKRINYKNLVTHKSTNMFIDVIGRNCINNRLPCNRLFIYCTLGYYNDIIKCSFWFHMNCMVTKKVTAATAFSNRSKY